MGERVLGYMIEVDTSDKLRVDRVEGLSPGGLLMLDWAKACELRDWLNANVRDHAQPEPPRLEDHLHG